MALKMSITLTDSFGEPKVFADACLRVENVSGNKSRMMLEYKIYRRQKDSKVLKAACEKFVPALDGENFIAQAYAHLKSMPDFAKAQDC
jgi:hypothetical protein